MRPHEKLDVWKNSVELVTRIYDATRQFPSDERYGLTSQIRRAAVSIPANLAEGAARMHDKEFLNFISIAQGSSSELETELLIANNLGYLKDDELLRIVNDVNLVARQMIGLSNHLKNKVRSKMK